MVRILPTQKDAASNLGRFTPTANDSSSAFRGQHNGAVLTATEDDLEELIGAVAAEANHEPSRPRQQRLDAAFDALNHAAASRR